MARAGIYKSEVLKVRKTLLAQGRYPSVDAVRQELGNTGSKSTIHRYLKEIEEEEGAKVGSEIRLSEPLQDLVARLSDRLQLEAEARIEELTARHAEELARQHEAQKVTEKEMASLRLSLTDTQAELKGTRERLQLEILAHTLKTTKLNDLEDQLRAEAELRRSFEEKHAHARESLEHFRAASKEQREQAQRQHEQQVQYLQGEIKSLQRSLVEVQNDASANKQTSARLASDLSRAEHALSSAQEELRSLKGVRAELVAAEQQVERLGRQVVQLQADEDRLRSQNTELETGRTADRAEIQQLRMELATARATAETQDQLVEKIQGWIAKKPATKQASASKR